MVLRREIAFLKTISAPTRIEFANGLNGRLFPRIQQNQTQKLSNVCELFGSSYWKEKKKKQRGGRKVNSKRRNRMHI